MSTEPKSTCPTCGTELSGAMECCPVCMLRQGLHREGESGESALEEALKPTPAQPPGRFEHYELVKGEDGNPVELGRGAMGVTYKAFDVDLRLPVTLKLISEKYIGDESAQLRFLREARAAAKVRHSNVAAVFHLGRSSQGYFYAMEFVEGETLESLIKRSGRLEVYLALEIALQVAAGLAAVHKQNLVHRDIKPSNIMVSLEGGGVRTAKIIDLGLAKTVGDSSSESAITVSGGFAGTPEFASPEQFAGVGIDIRSDLYSLGMTLWQMLTGQTPFRGSPAEVMYQHQRAALPLEQVEGVPQPVVALVEVLVEKNPARRLQSPAELLYALPKVTDAVKARRTITHQNLRELADKPVGASPKATRIWTNLRDGFATRKVGLILWPALVLVIGGGVWWFGYRLHREIQAIGEEARHITKEKIRAQLLQSVERARQAALAVAQESKGWEERERLRQAAEKAYAESVSRIDELAASFTEIEGTARSSQVFDEMTRILAEEGVDQALAYATTQRPGILEKVKARAAAARENNRGDLLPLFKSAQLQADRNQPAEAESLFADILTLEPDWPDARNAFAWFLIQQGIRVEPAKGNLDLKKAVEICQGTIALNERGESPQSWAAAQNDLGNALLELGRRSGGEAGHKLLEDALAAYRSALEVGTRADRPRDWATTQNNLGFALYELGIRSDGEEGRKLLEDALAAYRSALEVRSKADLPQDWAWTQNNLADALYDLGTRSTGEEGRKLLRDSAAALHSALEVRTRADRPQDWAWTQSNLGNVLQELGTRSAGEEGRKLLRDAVAAFRSALEVYTRVDLPQDWAWTQNNLGTALRELGKRTGADEGRKLLEDSVAAYRSALEVRTRGDLPQDWAWTQNNLGAALAALGACSGPGEEGRKLLEDAVATYRSALEIRTKANLPLDWAWTQNNLSAALQELGVRSTGEESRALLQDALAASRSALEVFTKANLPLDWAASQNNLGLALYGLGTRGAGDEGRKLLQDAVTAYRCALEVRTKADLPQDWAQTQNNLSDALAALGNELEGEEGLQRKRESLELLRDVMSYQPDDLSRYRLASALGALAFNLVLNSQFTEAQTRCEEAQKLANEVGDVIQKSDRDNLIFIQKNLAHALLFQGHYDEALAIYRQYWEKPLEGKTFGEVALEDFAAFDKAGLTHPDLSRMKKALAGFTLQRSRPMIRV
jgi:tetratricopeptide (TPR) repeat protein